MNYCPLQPEFEWSSATSKGVEGFPLSGLPPEYIMFLSPGSILTKFIPYQVPRRPSFILARNRSFSPLFTTTQKELAVFLDFHYHGKTALYSKTEGSRVGCASLITTRISSSQIKRQPSFIFRNESKGMFWTC